MDLLSKIKEIDYLHHYIIPWGINLLLALSIFFIGRWLAKTLTGGMRTMLSRAKVEPTLGNFLGNIAYAALLVVVVIAALNQLGVNTSSIMAIFAAAGLAVGLALKDSLSNFAAGIMLIMFKPFKVGDAIDAAGTSGVVETISIFHTILHTVDNRQITVPNSQVYSGIIVNTTTRPTRRIDISYVIGYANSVVLARQLALQVATSEAGTLAEPVPTVTVAAVSGNSVTLQISVWVATTDFGNVKASLLERLKETFDANGIVPPAAAAVV